MKRFIGVIWLFAALLLGSATAVAAPDLIVTGFGVVSDFGDYVRVRYTVRNQGTSSAPIIKISAEARRSTGVFYAVPQSLVSGAASGDGWYLWTSSRLAAGSSRTIYARLTMPSSWAAGRVYLRILVDSCFGDEFMPSYCRARESNESNNFSSVQSFLLD